MPDNKLTIRFRGNSPDENLTLEDFSGRMTDFNAALMGLDEFLSSRKKITVLFQVVNLKHESPSEVTVEAFAREDSLEDNSNRIMPFFIGAIENLNAGNGVNDLPRAVLEPMYKIAKSIQNSVKEIRIEWGSKSVFVTSRIAEILAEALENEKIIIGSLKGMLDSINVHKGANSFRIFPVLGPNYVTCHFPTELKDRAKASIERYVEVTGRLHYRIGAEHPHVIDAEEIVAMPDEKDLPTLGSLRGIIEIKDNKTSEELLEEQRRGQWE